MSELILSSNTLTETRHILNNAFSGEAVFNTVTSTSVNHPFKVITNKWDCAKSSNAVLTMTSNVELVLANFRDGIRGTLIVNQDNTGGWFLKIAEYDAPNFFENGAKNINIDPSAVSTLSFYYTTSIIGSGAFYWEINTNYI